MDAAHYNVVNIDFATWKAQPAQMYLQAADSCRLGDPGVLLCCGDILSLGVVSGSGCSSWGRSCCWAGWSPAGGRWSAAETGEKMRPRKDYFPEYSTVTWLGATSIIPEADCAKEDIHVLGSADGMLLQPEYVHGAKLRYHAKRKYHQAPAGLLSLQHLNTKAGRL